MIKVDVKTNPDGFMQITADGHAKSDVCRAVSAILQTNVRVLQELAEQFPDEIEVITQEVLVC